MQFYCFSSDKPQVSSEFTIQSELLVIMEIQIFLIFSDIRLSCHP